MDAHLLVGILATALIGMLLTYRLAHLVANLIEVLLPVLGNLEVLSLIRLNLPLAFWGQQGGR